MKPAPFAYEEPRSLGEAVDLLARHGEDAKLLAGGQSLIPLLNFRLARPEVLVDVNRLPGLGLVRRAGGELRIGALTRMAALERSPLIRERWPLLAEAARLVGHPQIRSRGTVGGSVAHADPAAELPAALVALGARFRVASSRGERELGADDFFLTHLTTALEPDELLLEVVVPPLPAGTRTAIIEHARVHGDFALAGAAVAVGPEPPVIVLLAAGPRPLRAVAAEEALAAGASIEEVAALAADVVDASRGDYRRALAAEMSRRALEKAAA